MSCLKGPFRWIFYVCIVVLAACNSAADSVTTLYGEEISKKNQDRLVLVYEFNEGEGNLIGDSSGFGDPLNVVFNTGDPITWVAGGIRIDAATTALISETKATKIMNALMQSNEMTLEAWIKPSNINQLGPARIFAITEDKFLHNIMLGQETDHYRARMRTTGSEVSGKPEVISGQSTASLNLTHVVLTWSLLTGRFKLYVNGIVDSEVERGGEVANAWEDFFLILANERGGGRAWLGEIYYIAMYDMELDAAQVENNFQAGSEPLSVEEN